MSDIYEFIDAEYAITPARNGQTPRYRVHGAGGWEYQGPDSMSGGPGQKAQPQKGETSSR